MIEAHSFLNREFQRELLVKLRGTYPANTPMDRLELDHNAEPVLRAVSYLKEHGLLDAHVITDMSGQHSVLWARITAAGLDFLEQDGGLTAVLGVVTVRLDAETIRELIADKVETLPLPAEEKSRITGWLKTAGTEALKEATKRLVQAGIDHGPELPRLLQTLLS